MKHGNSRTLKLIILMALSVVAVGVLAAALTIFSRTKSPEPSHATVAPEFKLLPTSALSYKTSIATRVDSATYDSIFERSSNGDSRFTTKSNDLVTAHVYSGETTYSCSASSCEKVRLDDNTGQYAYDYSPSKIKTLRDGAHYLGERACPAGTCNVWSWDDSSALSPHSDELYIDKSSDRISQVIIKYSQSASVVTVRYEFVPVTITLPPVPSEIPGM